MEEPFQPKLVASLKFGRVDNYLGKIHPVSASITFVRKNKTVLRWEVSLSLFECVFGLSRLAKLVPDKLRTAASINAENLEDPEDDGSFMVDLIVNLLKFYLDKAVSGRDWEAANLRNRKNRVVCDETEVKLEIGPFDLSDEEEDCATRLDFEQTLLTLWRGLLQFRTLLQQRAGKEKLGDSENELFDLATDLLVCCYAYLDFVHPYWREVQKSGEEWQDNEEMETLRSNVVSKIKACKKEMLLCREDAAEDGTGSEEEEEEEEEEEGGEEEGAPEPGS
jgi:hypothetical protein